MQVESDCLVIIQSLSSSKKNWSINVVLLDDDWSLLSTVNAISVDYISRNINRVAHALAKAALRVYVKTF